jgi:DNA helicase-4
VRFLVEKQDVKPEEILVISFTNKAVNELKERINHNLNIACPISTFHSIGNSIMNTHEDGRKRIVDNGYMFNAINRYLKDTVLRDSELVDKLILFFGSYFTAPYEGDNLAEYFQFISSAEFSTIKSNAQDYIQQVIDRKTKEVKTLNNEVLRSQEEVNIANFLYLHQIDYEYEPFYQYQILDSNKPYTPDFVIRQGDKVTYIEHFGITQSGNNNLYSASDLEKYKKRINDKVILHRKHKTDLIYTFSQYNDGADYLVHLKEELLSRGYVLIRRPSEEVYKKIVNSEETKYIVKLVKLICNFISNFKTQGYREEHFDIFKSKTKNVRTRLFLDICRTCYLEYQKCLVQDSSTDFEDMINESAELIEKRKYLRKDSDISIL